MSSTPLPTTGPTPTPFNRPSDARTLLLIARRGALESLRDRMSLGFNLFFALIFPIGMVVGVISRQVDTLVAGGRTDALGTALAIYLLSIGLVPATGAVGVASGQFAGEMEKGNLAPLLASPASNFAIFGGKILGSVLPAFLFSIVAEIVYLTSLAIVVGPDKLRLLPPGLSLALLALIPAVAIFAAGVASLISSRVRTFNTAQQLGGLALFPFWGGIFVLSLKLQDWGNLALIAVILGLVLADILLITIAAATWRREEVLAQR
ncbi:MAG: ABC transporter permease [Thermomicrobiales bacterium]